MAEERKLVGMLPKYTLGLGMLVWPFGIVALCIEKEKMTKKEKAFIISGFVLMAITYIYGLIVSIINGIVVAASDGNVTFVALFNLVLIIPLIFWVIAVIKAFMGQDYEIPMCYNIAKGFVKTGADEPAAEEKSEEKSEEKAEAKEEDK